VYISAFDQSSQCFNRENWQCGLYHCEIGKYLYGDLKLSVFSAINCLGWMSPLKMDENGWITREVYQYCLLFCLIIVQLLVYVWWIFWEFMVLEI